MMLRIFVGYFLTVFCNCIHWSRVSDMDGKEIQANGTDYQCNRLTCAIECSKLSLCYSFNHDIITNRCVLYDDVISTGVYDDTTTSKWRYYKSPERPKIQVSCPDTYQEVSDLCFSVYSNGGLGLEYSRLVCQSDDADLVIVDSKRKQEIINPYLIPDKLYLFGLYSPYFSSEYEWIDGLTDVNYTNWSPNQPGLQQSDQLCAFMEYVALNDRFQWGRGYDCQVADGFVCEITGFTT